MEMGCDMMGTVLASPDGSGSPRTRRLSSGAAPAAGSSLSAAAAAAAAAAKDAVNRREHADWGNVNMANSSPVPAVPGGAQVPPIALEEDEGERLGRTNERHLLKEAAVGRYDNLPSLQVVVRCRPLLRKEIRQGDKRAVVCTQKDIMVDDEMMAEARHFTFDRVFGLWGSRRDGAT